MAWGRPKVSKTRHLDRLQRLLILTDSEYLDGRYSKLSAEQLELSRAESLKDTADRIMPFFNSVVVPAMQAGNKCVIVSHANTIRTLVKQIDGISDEDIKGMTIPTGVPLLYRLDKDMKPVDPQMELEFRYMVQPKGYVTRLRSVTFEFCV